MANARQTFSESWYRVAELKPQLLAAVRTQRQFFRGQMWHIVHDPANNQFYRLNEAAYGFIGMLDGERTTDTAWRISLERFGDAAPTQNEVIQLLGQLYVSNLIHCELSADSAGLFKRYRKRVNREIRGVLMNFMFPRFPIWDPDSFLNWWLPVVGWLFSWVGFILWGLLVGGGGYAALSNFAALWRQSSGTLSPGNLPFLYLAFTLIKLLHEAGHAFACKKFGQEDGSGGNVHVFGIMLLMLTPVPYVDASSSWGLRDKWRRALVGAAGMLVELAAAAVCCVVWAQTSEGTTVNALAFNAMFAASVSTLLFNGNPLMRYDAYYILCDILELPNLATRSREYLYYLVKRYAWGVRNGQNPARTFGERIGFFSYGLASAVYRIVLFAGILLFVSEKLFVLGVLMALGGIVTWLFLPTGKFVRYLIVSPELERVRSRALLTTGAVFGLCGLLIGLLPLPDRYRVEGIVEPIRQSRVYVSEDGILEYALPSNTAVSGAGEPLIVLKNPDLETRRRVKVAKIKELHARRLKAETENLPLANILEAKIIVQKKRLKRLRQRVEALSISSPISGIWVAPGLNLRKGEFLKRGAELGRVLDLRHLVIRVTAGQDAAAPVIDAPNAKVDFRLQGRPEVHQQGTVSKILLAGYRQLPTSALGYPVGGELQVDPRDPNGTKTAERFFEIFVRPEATALPNIFPGQVIVLRFELQKKPLLLQWWRSLLRIFQRRLHI